VVVALDVDAGPVIAAAPIDAGVAEVPIDAAAARPDGDRLRPGSGAGSARRPIDAGAGGDDGDDGDAPDAAELRAKFSAATREYKAYKERMGDRLEPEWTDLATRVGYLSTADKRIAFDKAIDRFRAAMKQ
jgi:hypothetical protein